MRRHRVAVCGIQEHRKVQTASSKQNRETQRTHVSATLTSDRVITASFKSNPTLTPVTAYAPTLLAPEQEKRKS